MSPGRQSRSVLEHQMTASNKTANAFLGPRPHFQPRPPRPPTVPHPAPDFQSTPTAATAQAGQYSTRQVPARHIVQTVNGTAGTLEVTSAPQASPVQSTGSLAQAPQPSYGDGLPLENLPATDLTSCLRLGVGATCDSSLPPLVDLHHPEVDERLPPVSSTPLLTTPNTPASVSTLHPTPQPAAADPSLTTTADSVPIHHISSLKRPRLVHRSPNTQISRANISASLPSPTPTDEPSPAATGTLESPRPNHTQTWMENSTVPLPSGLGRAPGLSSQVSHGPQSAAAETIQQASHQETAEPCSPVAANAALQIGVNQAPNPRRSSEALAASPVMSTQAVQEASQENLLDLLALINKLRARQDQIAPHLKQTAQDEILARRLFIVRGAVEQGDIFYLILHQVLCIWSHDRTLALRLLGVSRDTAHIVESALTTVDLALHRNSAISPDHLHWFAYFPAAQLTQFQSPAYGPYLGEIVNFLTYLGRNWHQALNMVKQRGYPLLVSEFERFFRLDSSTLQGILFTVSRRYLGVVVDGPIAHQMTEWFQEDRRRTKAVLTTDQREEFRKKLLAVYVKLVASYRQQESALQSQAMPQGSYPPRAQQPSGPNLQCAGQTQGPGSPTGFRPSPTMQNQPGIPQRGQFLKGQQMPMGQWNMMAQQQVPVQQRQPAPFARQHMSPNLAQLQAQQQQHQQQMAWQGQGQGQGQGPSMMGQRPLNSPQMLSNQQVPGMSPMRTMSQSLGHISDGRVLPQQQQQQHQRPFPGPGQAINRRVPQNMAGAPTVVPSSPVTNSFPATISNMNNPQQSAASTLADPQTVPWNQFQPQLSAMSSAAGMTASPIQMFTTVPVRTQVQPQQQRQASASQHRSSGATQRAPATQSAAGTRGPTIFVPPQSQVIRIDRHPPSPHDPRSIEMSLHMVDVRSPRRIPLSLPSNPTQPIGKYYQALKCFAAKPIIINSNGDFTQVTLEISPEDFQTKMSRHFNPPGDSMTVCSYFDGSWRYRLRTCEVPTNELATLSESAWAMMPTSWPDHMFITVNKKSVKIRRKTHHGSHQPAELTPHIQPGKNEVAISVLSPVKSTKAGMTFVAVIELVETLSHASVKAMVETQGMLPADVTPAVIKRRLEPPDEEDELFVTDNTLSVDVTEPYSMQLFTVPARGLTCTHLECFDLDIFLDTRQPKKMCPHKAKPGCTTCRRLETLGPEPSVVDGWKCPICNKDARPSSLRIDMFMQGVRDKLIEEGKGNTKSILVKADGSWVAKIEEDDDDFDADEPAPKRRKSENVSGEGSRPEPVVIIELD